MSRTFILTRISHKYDIPQSKAGHDIVRLLREQYCGPADDVGTISVNRICWSGVLADMPFADMPF
jgi:hypothetical protein